MNHEELLKHCEGIFNEMLDVMKRKNADYAGSGKSGFHNFMVVESLGIASTEVGMLTRMSDKMSRLATLLAQAKEGQVKDESIKDTLKDLANYSVLLCAYLDWKG